MEHKPHYQRKPKDPNAIPKSDPHIKDHIIKYVDSEAILKFEKYYEKLTEVHGQHPSTIHKR